jgi:hypothetical protein
VLDITTQAGQKQHRVIVCEARDIDAEQLGHGIANVLLIHEGQLPLVAPLHSHPTLSPSLTLVRSLLIATGGRNAAGHAETITNQRELGRVMRILALPDDSLILIDPPEASLIAQLPVDMIATLARPAHYKRLWLIFRDTTQARACADQLDRAYGHWIFTSTSITPAQSQVAQGGHHATSSDAIWHTNVQIIQTRDRDMLDGIMADPMLGQLVTHRLSDTVAAIAPGGLDEVDARLRKLGHTPKRTS